MLQSFPCTLGNFYERYLKLLRHIDGNQSFSFLDMSLWTPLMSSVVSSRPLTCKDLSFYSGNEFFRVGPNISLLFQTEPTLRGFKLNMTAPNQLSVGSTSDEKLRLEFMHNEYNYVITA